MVQGTWRRLFAFVEISDLALRHSISFVQVSKSASSLAYPLAMEVIVTENLAVGTSFLLACGLAMVVDGLISGRPNPFKDICTCM